MKLPWLKHEPNRVGRLVLFVQVSDNGITRGHISKIKDIDALKRIGEGDLTPIDEVRDVTERERLDTSTRALQRRKEAQEKRERAREAAARYLKPRRPSDDVDYTPSTNGHSKQPTSFK